MAGEETIVELEVFVLMADSAFVRPELSDRLKGVEEGGEILLDAEQT